MAASWRPLICGASSTRSRFGSKFVAPSTQGNLRRGFHTSCAGAASSWKLRAQMLAVASMAVSEMDRTTKIVGGLGIVLPTAFGMYLLWLMR